MSISLRLSEGYSNLLEGSRVVLRLRGGPADLSLDLSPMALVRQKGPAELDFEVAEGFRGRGPNGLRWRVAPGGSVRSKLLFPGNAFLGNFRVPEEHFAVQWDVEGLVESSLAEGQAWFLNVRARSRLHQAWVELFPAESSLGEALQQAWRHFPNPLDPASAERMRSGQVVRWTASGRIRLVLQVEWGLRSGWAIPGWLPGLQLRNGVRAAAVVGANFEISDEGRFHLQLSRRDAQTRFSLRKTRIKSRHKSARASLWGRSSMRVARLGNIGPQAAQFWVAPLAEPLRKEINERLSRALSRRLEISAALESDRSRHRSAVVKAVWNDRESKPFVREYADVLAGRLPPPRPGLELSGTLQRLRSKRFSVQINFLDWLKLGASREKKQLHSVSQTPDGQLVIEEGTSLQKTVHRWDELQFFRLVRRSIRGPHGVARELVWSYGLEDSFSRDHLRRVLRIGLQSGVLGQFELPPSPAFPLNLSLVIKTRFSEKGIEKVRRTSTRRVWQGLVRSLELAQPGHYARGSFGRDWIDLPEVREVADRNPVQAHLESVYPVAGRSDAERQQVISAYLRAKRFLGFLEEWKEQEGDSLESFQPGLGVPIFILFHLLCPAVLRRSAAVLTGDLERVWGDEELLASDRVEI